MIETILRPEPYIRGLYHQCQEQGLDCRLDVVGSCALSGMSGNGAPMGNTATRSC